MIKLKHILQEEPSLRIKVPYTGAPPWLDKYRNALDKFKVLNSIKTLLANVTTIDKELQAACITKSAPSFTPSTFESIQIKPKDETGTPCQPGSGEGRCSTGAISKRISTLYDAIYQLNKEAEDLILHVDKVDWCKGYDDEKERYDQYHNSPAPAPPITPAELKKLSND